jgi:DNA-binding CsgD family transcriptional regulator
MMNTNNLLAVLSNTDRKMLELLLKGASGRTIAQSLGYKEGTTRVYLHSLYKRIGVKSKTSAATWYLDATADKGDALASPTISNFGDMALKSGLLDSLGFLAHGVGPYGHIAEASVGRKPRIATAPSMQVRALTRSLWESLLAGNFVEGKRQYDGGALTRLIVESPAGAVVLTLCLILGGYTSSAKRAIAALPPRKGGSLGATENELRVVRATFDAVERSSNVAVAALSLLTVESGARPEYRHILLATLFQFYRTRGDTEGAKATAHVIWQEVMRAAAANDMATKSSLPSSPATKSLSTYLAKLSEPIWR